MSHPNVNPIIPIIAIESAVFSSSRQELCHTYTTVSNGNTSTQEHIYQTSSCFWGGGGGGGRRRRGQTDNRQFILYLPICLLCIFIVFDSYVSLCLYGTIKYFVLYCIVQWKTHQTINSSMVLKSIIRQRSIRYYGNLQFYSNLLFSPRFHNFLHNLYHAFFNLLQAFTILSTLL